MRRDHDLEAIVNAAFEEGTPASDADPRDERYAEFRKLSKALRSKHFDAPPQLIERAKTLLQPKEKRTVWARLVGGSVALAGARAAGADSFQLVFEAESEQARLMYVREGSGWEVAGQAPPEFEVEHRGKVLKLNDQGRFIYRAKKLGDTGLILRRAELEIRIPAADQANENEPRGTS